MENCYWLIIHWIVASQKDSKLIYRAFFFWFGDGFLVFLLLDYYFGDNQLFSLKGVKPIANTAMFRPRSK